MTRRITTATILLSVILLGFTFPQLWWLIVALIACIGLMCTFEMAAMLRLKGIRIFRRIAAFGVLALMAEAVVTQMNHSMHVFGILVVLAWIVRLSGRVQGAWNDVAGTCFVLAYVGIPMAALTRIYLAGPAAEAWLMLALSIIWTTDSVALFSGRIFGHLRLSPRISPGKTWEGSFGGLTGAVIVTFLGVALFPNHFVHVSEVELVLFALGLSIVAQYGDLAESLIKRDVGVKDSGSRLTGHGGFLDLMDAVLFCAMPLLAYLYVFQPQVLFES